MLIDEFLPRYDVVERHQLRIRASAVTTYAALLTTDFAVSGLLRALLALRALPAALRTGPAGWRALRARDATPLTLATLEASGFTRLAATPPTELVLGLEGRFWTLAPERCAPLAAAFRTTAPAPGTARAVWSFAFHAKGPAVTLVTTETRVLCADAAARRRFLPYWALVRPGSGLIRRAMLRRLRDTVERRAI